MAVTFTGKITDSWSGTAAASRVTSSSYTPTTNALQLAVALLGGGAGITADPTLTGAGLTWVLVSRFNAYGNTARTLCIYRALGTGSNGALTLTAQGADTFARSLISVVEVAGVATSGSNGSGAVSQVATNTNQTTQTPFVNIVANSASNALYGIFASFTASPTFTPGDGYTEVHDFSSAGNHTLATASRTTTDTNADGTWASGTPVCSAAVLELVPAGPSIDTQPTAQTARLNGDATTTATFTCAATGTGTVTNTAEIESSVGSGTYGTLANGSGATWTGLTASGSGSASTTLVGTFTAKTHSGKRIRIKSSDSNGDTYSDAVVLTVLDGPVLSASSATTNGSGVASVTMTSDDALTANGEILLVTASINGTVIARTTVRPA